jgi:micrococcal nuclease
MYQYFAKVTNIVDGDTLDLDIDVGFNVHIYERIRLYGINTPEIHGAKAKIEKEAGLVAKIFVENWLDANSKNADIILQSFDSKKLSQEKYGRWLGVITSINGGISLNDALVENGHAIKVTY